jgi:hypothetical protein
MLKERELKIIVIYVGVAGVRSEDIDSFVKTITGRIVPVTFEGEIITIPVQSQNTWIDCINPKYITDEALIKEHTDKMKKLQDELQNQLERLKEGRG